MNKNAKTFKWVAHIRHFAYRKKRHKQLNSLLFFRISFNSVTMLYCGLKAGSGLSRTFCSLIMFRPWNYSYSQMVICGECGWKQQRVEICPWKTIMKLKESQVLIDTWKHFVINIIQHLNDIFFDSVLGFMTYSYNYNYTTKQQCHQ